MKEVQKTTKWNTAYSPVRKQDKKYKGNLVILKNNTYKYA